MFFYFYFYFYFLYLLSLLLYLLILFFFLVKNSPEGEESADIKQALLFFFPLFMSGRKMLDIIAKVQMERERNILYCSNPICFFTTINIHHQQQFSEERWYSRVLMPLLQDSLVSSVLDFESNKILMQMITKLEVNYMKERKCNFY